MIVYLIDGHGGGVGRVLAERLKSELPRLELIAIGTNSVATAAMRKAGADNCATGENSIVYCSGRAGPRDVIAGPLGIVLANSMLGEFSPSMAKAVAESAAHKILIPSNRCRATVAGVAEKTLAQYIEDALELIRSLSENNGQ